MTEIEKFYKTFDIKPFIYCSKPRLDCPARKVDTCTKECEYYSGILYPDITDRILLELICLHSTWCEPRLCATNIEAIKRQVLRDLIFENCEKLKQQVQKLFK